MFSRSYLRQAAVLLASSIFYLAVVYYAVGLNSTYCANFSLSSSHKSSLLTSLQDHVLDTRDLIPYSVLDRGHFDRETQLILAMMALEYWWSLREGDKSGEFGPCPLSMSSPPDFSGISNVEERERMVFSQLQAIAVMEAFGLTNMTTCEERYPRLALDVEALREGNDNIYTTETTYQNSFISDRDEGVTFDGEELFRQPPPTVPSEREEDEIRRRFCYTPAWRPQFQNYTESQLTSLTGTYKHGNIDDVSTAWIPAPTLSKSFCARLLALYRGILSGREPPLLALFTWIPDPFQDNARTSRAVMLKNLNLLRPFVKPVLVSDRRHVMATAFKMGWPFLQASKVSPDNLPVFQPVVENLMDKVNATFYGYIQATSAFDSSLLETLLAVRDKYLKSGKTSVSGSTESPQLAKSNDTSAMNTVLMESDPQAKLLLYGTALYKNNLKSTNKLFHLGQQAKSRGKTDWQDKEASLIYFIHTRLNFSDIPPLQLADGALTSFLVNKSKSLGHVVLDASKTILCVKNKMVRRQKLWNRVDLIEKPLNRSYNLLLAADYMSKLKVNSFSWYQTLKPTVIAFDDKGEILFDNP